MAINAASSAATSAAFGSNAYIVNKIKKQKEEAAKKAAAVNRAQAEARKAAAQKQKSLTSKNTGTKKTTDQTSQTQTQTPYTAQTLDISKISYQAVAVLTNGDAVHLEEVATNIAWEENENELATRLNLTIRDVDLGNGKGRLATKLSLCTAVYLYYDIGNGQEEAFRGTIWEWKHSQIHDDEIVITAYDLLYYLQKSEDYGMFSAGQSTKAVCQSVLSNWGVPLSRYDAPSMTHEKLALKTKKVSAILTEVLDMARFNVGMRYFIRSTKGNCEIIGPGTNDTIWTFSAETNLITSSDQYSMTNIITKIVIMGKEDKDGEQRPPVEAIEYGKTEYGTIQKIMSLGSKTLETAQAEAKQTIAKNGTPTRKLHLVSPDFPVVRKGDRIRVVTDNVNGYFCVLTVSHNATNQQMQMEVEPI